MWSGTAFVFSEAVTAQDAATPLAFDFASIKRNLSGHDSSLSGTIPGQTTLVNVSLPALILRGYPGDAPKRRWDFLGMPASPEVLGLPPWAEFERFDIVVKTRPDATPVQQQEMWQDLLVRRMKLLARYEMRDEPSYDLVLARPDRRLGPELTPTALDCSVTPARPPLPFRMPTPEQAMALCGWVLHGDDMFSGGVTMTDFANIVSRAAGRIVVDRTGLEGWYSLRLTIPDQPSDATAARADDAPSIFTALPEQLGLRLEPSTTQVQAVVVDYIEPLKEN